MSRRATLALALLLLAALLPAGGAVSAPPNIVLIVADDLGFNDVGYRNPEVRTPSIDRLAAEGVTLERFYTAPKCTPTRSALLTGRYAIRWGMERDVIRQYHEVGLPPAERTLPETLRRAGYATMIAGKWHLGHAYSKFHPLRQGFDRFLGNYLGQVDYYSHSFASERDWHDGFRSRPEDDGLYHTDLVGTAAADFVREQARASRPFFLYVPFLAPHPPQQAPGERILDYFERGVPQPRATFLAKVSAMDAAIGSILEALASAGVAESTVVWFMSDNGGRVLDGADNSPLRGGKGIPWEGAIRVAAVVRYPAGLTAGTASEALISAVDVLPTLTGIVERAGASPPPPPRPLDGIDMYAVIQGRAAPPDKDHFAFVSLRDGRREDYGLVTSAGGRVAWKLIWMEKKLLDNPDRRDVVRLYDLAADPGESRDLAGRHPEVVDDLVAKLVAWRRLRPEPGALLDRRTAAPPGWQPRPDWRFIDRPPQPGEDRLALYRPATGFAQQVRQLREDGTVERLALTTHPPDGAPELVLGAVGRDRAAGTIYALARSGRALYEIDSAGLLIGLGEVEGIAPDAKVSALAVAPGGAELRALDGSHGRLYAIDLADLIARPLPLEDAAPGSGRSIADLVWDPEGRLLGYDAASRRVVTLAGDGRLTPSRFEYRLADRLEGGIESGTAIWLDGSDHLMVYRPAPGGPQLFRLDLARGGVERLAFPADGR